MRFGVLGPLQVWADGEPVRIAETKVRALLADLLAHEGKLVTTDRLIEDLWGDQLPANPKNTLQTRVWQLRKAIGADRVLSHPSGYQLRFDPDEVDMLRFEALVTQARQEPPSAKARLLAEALRLWRGPAFEDADFARPVIERLDDLRLAALEDQAEARLELGEDVSLSELVARHPLRERLRGLHMRALKRAGRQTEALESYHQLRRFLAEELGVDPSPELNSVYQSILAQKTNLPAPVSPLIGRAHAIAETREALRDGRLVTLTGPGGVGKTRLAIEVARGLSFPDSVWLADLTSATHAPDVVAQVLNVRGRLVDALRTRRLLLILDNCEHLIAETAHLAQELLHAAPDLHILATSQEPLAVDGEQVLPVEPLDEASAVELFRKRARLSTVDPDVRAICRRLDGIPLALELAATRVRALGVRELAARLDDRFAVLTGERRGAPARQQTLRAMIDWSWGLLTPDEQVVLRRLSVTAGGCTLDAAIELTGDRVDVLARLVDRSLVVMPRYRLLESVAAYSQQRLAEAGELDWMRQRHRAYYTELAEEASKHLRGHGQQEWLQKLDAESANFRRALNPRLAHALSWYWFLRGRFGEAQRAFAHDDSPTGRAWYAGFTLLIRDSAEPEIPDGDIDPRARWFLSYAQRGFTGGMEFDEPQDSWDSAIALYTKATSAFARGDFQTAQDLGKQSQALLRELGDGWGQVKAAQVLALLAEVRGDYQESARLHENTLRLAEELGLWTEASYELSGLGRIALLRGDYRTADELHTRAARLASEQSHQRGVQFAEVGLGLSARRQGNLDDAETHFRTWLEWCRRWGGDAGTALILAELGFIAEQRGAAETALALHEEGLAVARATRDPRAVALALEGLAGAHSLAGRTAQAAELLAEADQLRQSVGAPLPPSERGDVDRIRERINQA
ncbi:BTAD domain-containing putative transcriptional regulator [Kibdelosporangium aridum]|uniref:Predicted ATPase n=1 Tax=Kibdelosporangium aridum TaxID=2030 RepID=A0A1W2EW76_KIBAR|nr:BTAD domain-containing putative transcriptional regulator [Kibdelosporangium aridum]SMD13949.1 Predicted ATPase [Kibdelosporangium aridum]